MSGTTKSWGVLTVLIAVLGGAVLLGTGATAAVAGVHQTGRESGELQADPRGVTSLGLDVTAARVQVEFRDVSEVQLRIQNGSPSGWTLRRIGDELRVRGPQHGFDWFRMDWFGPNRLRDDERATLILPEQLRGIDARLTLRAGALSVDGSFGALHVTVNAGACHLEGEAREVHAALHAGRANIDLAEVTTAEYTVAAGRVTSTLRSTPDAVTLSVSAGSLELTLPDTDYDLRQDVSAGSLNSRLTQNSDSPRRITATVSAGSASLRPAE